ncbi:hypothetical protein D3875_10340 [Deinococcus cavernae]|uniref:DUF4064 domain-containing protein n=1 Tax=Deinococcus cavernae TaxID=2320857 RepID=A0A418V741_9DEIO|nr:hypothetical protein [Deinococcus cavernae]RJF71902.1 hypothetical protein D3875_10340 [Deinococcus cavernae]
MTAPTPHPTQPPTQPRPPKLAFLTVPLLISLFTQCLSLLMTPFMGNDLNATLAEYGKLTGTTLPPLPPQTVQAVLWISLILTMALILWLYNTRRALLEGKHWGRVSAIVIAVFSLLLFPFGTLLGIVMLIGAFDREVVNYTRRK